MRLCWLVFALGCGPHTTAPATGGSATPTSPIDAAVAGIDAGPLDQDLDRLANRSLGLLDDLGRALAAGEDCTAATIKIGELTTRYADVIAANAKVLQEGREMQLKLALRRYDDRFQAAAKLVMESKMVAACAQDEAFTRAFSRLAGS